MSEIGLSSFLKAFTGFLLGVASHPPVFAHLEASTVVQHPGNGKCKQSSHLHTRCSDTSRKKIPDKYPPSGEEQVGLSADILPVALTERC